MVAPDPLQAPLVSVIVATYNQSASLSLALRSVLAQDLTSFEVLVIGDACTDGSAEVVDSFNDDRLHWINLPHNTGSQSGPNNAGLRRARGHYIAYLGHDDLWLPWHLSGLVEGLEAMEADLVHSLCPLIGPLGVVGALGPPKEGVGYANHAPPPSCWLHRRDLMTTLGLWNDPAALAWHIDFDYMRRASLAGKKIGFVPDLTMLKFPSPLFRPYATGATPPQQPYMRTLQEEPHELQRRILVGLSVVAATDRQCNVTPSFQHAMASLLAALLQCLRGAPLPFNLLEMAVRTLLKRTPYTVQWRVGYQGRAGHDRWPLSRYIYQVFQDMRRSTRRQRGLAP